MVVDVILLFSLDLNNNKIGDKGAEAIVLSIIKLSSLIYLFLGLW